MSIAYILKTNPIVPYSNGYQHSVWIDDISQIQSGSIEVYEVLVKGNTKEEATSAAQKLVGWLSTQMEAHFLIKSSNRGMIIQIIF